MSATLDRSNALTLTLTVPSEGVWVAECATDGPPPAEGARCLLTVLGVAYSGTCVRRGEYAGKGSARVVGGAASWGATLPPRGYHSDAGVRTSAVVADLARETGEALASPPTGILGTDWSRSTGEASRSLSAALRGGPWYVGADGLTYCSQRPSGAMAGQLLEWDPAQALAILAPGDSLVGVEPGRTISDERLPGPLTAREIRVELGGSAVRVMAWCPPEQGPGRAATALAAIVAQATPVRLWGKYRYRVFRMSVDRVEAQAVRKSSGLPDIVPVTMWTGLPGAWGDLTMGSEVLVEFIDGDPSEPIVTAFAPKGSGGFVPNSISLCDGQNPVARVGDTVTVFVAGPLLFTGTVGGSPATGTITASAPLMGVIGTGNPRVKA
jgi:hypothetical protein